MSLFLYQGSFRKEIFRKVAGEVSFRRLNTGNGMCKVGLEVDLKGGQDCRDNTGRKKMVLSDPRINWKKIRARRMWKLWLKKSVERLNSSLKSLLKQHSSGFKRNYLW